MPKTERTLPSQEAPLKTIKTREVLFFATGLEAILSSIIHFQSKYDHLSGEGGAIAGLANGANKPVGIVIAIYLYQ